MENCSYVGMSKKGFSTGGHYKKCPPDLDPLYCFPFSCGFRLPVKKKQTERPACCIKFLGVVIDTGTFKLWLPEGKSTLTGSANIKKSCTKELESLLEYFSHVELYSPKPHFLRQLFSLLQIVKAPTTLIS